MSLKYTLVVLATTVVCLLASSAQAAITSAEQRATLRFLQEFTDEYKKVLRPLWTGSNYCAWSGVTCDANDDVHVDLSGRGLSGDLPEPKKKEASLVRVVSIDLSNNPGIDDLESDWKYLTNLRKINLSYTSVKGYIPDQWRSMSSLEELHAHHTALCRNLPDWSAATMPNLRVVDLSYNNFHGSIRGDWASFRKLEKFDISGNNFCGCAPASWRNVPVLAAAAAQTPMGSATCAYNSCSDYKYCPKTPNMGGATTIPNGGDGTSMTDRYTLNFLREFVDEYKDVLRPLWTGDNYCAWSGVTCDANGDVHVDLSGRGLRGDLPEPEKKEARFVRVVSIDLSNNPGIDDLESDWKYLTNLRKIDLSYTSVKGYIPDQWRSMSSLEELHAHHTALCRNLPDWSAATMPNLRVVDLSYNNFHGSIRGDWASFRKLEKFDISGNNFCGCAPASWRNVPVLAAAAAQTPMGSATCAYNSCGNYKYCPKTPNRDAPTAIPTDVPTTIPTDVPTTIPTEAPTTIPSDGSTEAPDVPSGGANPPTLNFLREFTRKYKSTLEYLWTGENYCAWSGVTCDANGDVHVDLSGRGLTGELPEADEKDGALVRVVSIDLSNNAGISGRFKNSWKNLGNLRRINLSHTSLFGALPDAWNGMRIIEEVYITNTRACLGLPNWAMRTLRRVDLSNNNLKGALAYSWVNMVSLESANLAGNSFCACMPVNWIGRPALEAAVDTASNAATLRSSTCGISNYCTGASYQCY